MIKEVYRLFNARNMSKEKLVSTFVVTNEFRKMLSSTHQVILGARGSGKTALAKMLSHPYLASMDDEVMQEVVASKKFIGIFVPTNVEWVGTYRNKHWLSKEDAEQYFQILFNIAIGLSFLDTILSCLQAYCSDDVVRLQKELTLVRRFAKSWINDEVECNTLAELKSVIKDIEYDIHCSVNQSHLFGSTKHVEVIDNKFHLPIFLPLKRGIDIATGVFQLTDETSWLLCIDEAEFLEDWIMHRFNSYIRSDTGNLFLKITTLPYSHNTLSTNLKESVDGWHDFDYIYIDKDPLNNEDEVTIFANSLLKKIGEDLGLENDIDLRDILGGSKLLGEQSWREEYNEELLSILSPAQSKHARKLLDENKHKEYMSKYAWKLRGAMYLFTQIRSFKKGHRSTDLYSGAEVFVRVCDGNPRLMIRVLSELVACVKRDRGGRAYIDQKEQDTIIRSLSESILARTKSEDNKGNMLYQIVHSIGKYFKDYFHSKYLRTGWYGSVNIDNQSSKNYWQIIEKAVNIGLIYPVINTKSKNPLPVREGVFRLGYVLAPYFNLMPRKAMSQKLSTILNTTLPTTNYDEEKEQEQSPLF